MSGRPAPSHDDLKNAAPEYLMTVRDIHVLTGLSEKLIREAMSSGALKSMPIGSGEEQRVPKWRVRQWQRDATLVTERSINKILRKVS